MVQLDSINQLMINETLLLWGGFLLFILAMLVLDLGVFRRKAG